MLQIIKMLSPWDKQGKKEKHNDAELKAHLENKRQFSVEELMKGIQVGSISDRLKIFLETLSMRFTWVIRTPVLSAISTKITASNFLDITRVHILYCRLLWSAGMYRWVGFAVSANWMQSRCKRKQNAKKISSRRLVSVNAQTARHKYPQFIIILTSMTM